MLQRELNATAAAIYPCEQVAQALSGAGVSVIATNTAGVVTAAVVLQIAEYGIVKFTAAAIALMLLSNVLVTVSWCASVPSAVMLTFLRFHQKAVHTRCCSGSGCQAEFCKGIHMLFWQRDSCSRQRGENRCERWCTGNQNHQRTATTAS